MLNSHASSRVAIVMALIICGLIGTPCMAKPPRYIIGAIDTGSGPKLASVSPQTVSTLATGSGAKVIKQIPAADGKSQYTVVEGSPASVEILKEKLGPGLIIEPDLPRYLLQQGACTIPSAGNTSLCSCRPDVTGRMVGDRFVPYGVDMVQALSPTFLAITGAKFAGGVTTCILDTGLDRNHPDMAVNNVTGCELGDCDNSWFSAAFGSLAPHGTHVTGTIAAGGSPGGIVGTISQGTNLYIVNLFDDAGSARTSAVLQGLYACKKHLDALKKKDPKHKMVINLSLGAPTPSRLEAEFFKTLSQGGDMLFVAASGNRGSNVVEYPAGYPEVIAVGAIGCDFRRASFSSTNNKVELVAPGEQVNSTIPGDSVGGFGGWTPTIAQQGAVIAIVQGTGCRRAVTLTSARAIAGSVRRGVSAPTADCGDGTTDCTAAKGKICVVRQTAALSSFVCDLAERCQRAGGLGVIITSRDASRVCAPLDGSLGTFCFAQIPVVTLSSRDGGQLQSLLKANPSRVHVQMSVTEKALAYAVYDGTSMAAPHVSGVAAKLWNTFRDCSPAQIREALTSTALPLGNPGRDNEYGFGLVRAANAAFYLRARPCK